MPKKKKKNKPRKKVSKKKKRNKPRKKVFRKKRRKVKNNVSKKK